MKQFNTKVLFILLALAILGNIGFSLYLHLSQPKVAYVKSQVLIDKYQGMKEARKKFDAQSAQWQINIDTLRSEYNTALGQFEFNSTNNTKGFDREKDLVQLQFLQNNLSKYTEAIQTKLEEEENELLQGVINQMNSFIEEYGKKKDYDIVFGTTLSGSVLYGKEHWDITDELLIEMNTAYQN